MISDLSAANRHDFYLRQAIALAADAVERDLGGPFGCVIDRGGAVIGQGQNLVTSANDPTAHAEVMAIRQACAALAQFHLSGCTLYTSCEPCPMCLGAIYWAHLDRVFFAASRHDAANAGFVDEHLYVEIAKPITDREIPMTRHLPQEGMEPFELWNRKADRIEY